jgi:hypothetical protein
MDVSKRERQMLVAVDCNDMAESGITPQFDHSGQDGFWAGKPSAEACGWQKRRKQAGKRRS